MIEKLDGNISFVDMVNKINEIIDAVNNTNSEAIKPVDISDLSVHAWDGVKCPHCKDSFYTELYSTATLAYHPPVYKDGENVNAGINETIKTHCRCLSCGKEFDI